MTKLYQIVPPPDSPPTLDPQQLADLWARLVRITHWTHEDVAREAELRKALAAVRPDFVIESFAELLPLMRVGCTPLQETSAASKCD